VPKDGSNARKQAARRLARAGQIPYTEARRRIDQRAPLITAPAPLRTSDAALIGHTAPVYGVVFHPNGQFLVSASADSTAQLWDPASRQATAVLTGESPILSLALSPDGNTLAMGHLDGLITLWAVATGTVSTLTGCAGPVLALAFSPDGALLASNSADRSPGQGPPVIEPTVRLWDLAQGRASVVSAKPNGYGYALAFHPGGRLLASSAGLDGTAHLHDLDTLETTLLAGHDSGINTLTFSPDGLTLATGSVDSTVRLWDVASKKTTAVLSPHGHYVLALAFSPDGNTLATSSTDPTVRLWDPHTGQPRANLFDHTDYIQSIAFSPDGLTLATGSQDRTVRLWSLT
jgi:WD40 repeat protein